MTYEEAIKYIDSKQCGKCCGCDISPQDKCPYMMAIEALEKQIPKKPIYSDFNDNGFDEIIPYRAECPACGESVEFGKWNAEESHHCDCGQALSWEV